MNYFNRRLPEPNRAHFALVAIMLLLGGLLCFHSSTQQRAAIIAQMTEDMKNDLEDCQIHGGSPEKCMTMIRIWQQADTPIENAKDRCDATRINVIHTCIYAREEHSYYGGDVVYKAEQKAEEFPLCARYGEAAYNTCRNY